MKVIPSALQAHYNKSSTTIAVCWMVTLGDGTIIRGTEHDRNLVVADSVHPEVNGTYYAVANVTASATKSGADMAVDNMEVVGAIQNTGANVPDVNVTMIESGIMDLAPVLIFLCNWQAPAAGVEIIRSGRLGTLSTDSDNSYKIEIRGMNQYLSQTIGQTFGTQCDVVVFGDSRCKVDVAALTNLVAISIYTDRRNFVFTITQGNPPPVADYYNRATLTFTSGANNNFSREVKLGTVNPDGSITIELYDELPADAIVGDTASLPPGCDRSYAVCKNSFNNLVNRRAYGDFIPGIDAMMKGPI